MATAAHKPLRIFCSYSHKDEEHLNVLREWLRGLERQGLIEWWHDREIVPGWEWEEAIDKNLRTADVILLLVTPDFLASDYVFEKEINRAIERNERGEARVIPIIVRPALWKGTPLDKLQTLPKDARPITRWPDRDEAWLDVAEGIRKSVDGLLAERRERAAAEERYRKAVEEMWADNRVSDAEAEELGALASELDLSTHTAAELEREVMGDTKEAILERQEQATREKERQDQLDELYAQARRSHQNQEWQAVVDIFELICTEDPSYPDREGLLASAREALERMQRVAALYDRGQRHIDAEEWQQALERLEEIQQLEPGYRETEELLSQVRQELASPPTVEVPDLSGREIPQASSTLSSRDLKLDIQHHVSRDAVPEGRIIEQSPEAGTRVETGSSVSVTVSAGPMTVEVPDLVDKDHSNVRTTLNAVGLKLGEQVKAPSDDVPEGRIVKQDPAARTRAGRGSSVHLTISSGPQEKTAVTPSGQSGAEGAGVRTPSTERSATRNDAHEQQRKRLSWLPGIAVAGLVLALLIVVPLLLGRSPSNTESDTGSGLNLEGKTPIEAARSLEGKTLSDAAEKAAGTPYTLKIYDIDAGSSEPEGTVTTALPNRNDSYVINLWVSGGRGTVEVPDVTGLPAGKACKKLADARLDARIGGTQYCDLGVSRSGEILPDSSETSTVTGQDASAGTQVEAGEDVTIDTTGAP